MKCKNCIFFDGELCEERFDKDGDAYKPDNVKYCGLFKSKKPRYRGERGSTNDRLQTDK